VQGRQSKDIAIEVGLDRRQVALWRSRFLQGGIDALRQDAQRSDRTPTVTAELESKVLDVTLHSKPSAATHWSTRTLAEHLGMSAMTIRRVWQRNSRRSGSVCTWAGERVARSLARAGFHFRNSSNLVTWPSFP
jgi:hypothetical protein